MKVIHLKSDNDHDNINMIKNHMRTKPTLVFMVASWCGFCKRLQPTIDSLENELPEEPEFKRISVITVHDDQLKHIGQKVKSYPTIRMFKNGKAMPDYSDEFKREADDIRNYIREHIRKDKKSKGQKSKKKSRNMKTFKIKKTKSKPKNYKGPGSKDPKWFSKVFGIQNGGKYKKKSKKNSK